MVTGCVMTEDCPLSVSAERVWKVAFSGADSHSALRKACAGFIDAVETDGGDGGPGSVTTMTLSPAVAAGAGAGGATMRSRVVSRDSAAMAIRTEVLEGGRVSGLLKSQVADVRLVEAAAGDGGCVAKLTVEYERIDGGGALSAEDQASLAAGYLGLLKKVEAYLVANPAEYA